jgi:hypothetical protein
MLEECGCKESRRMRYPFHCCAGDPSWRMIVVVDSVSEMGFEWLRMVKFLFEIWWVVLAGAE